MRSEPGPNIESQISLGEVTRWGDKLRHENAPSRYELMATQPNNMLTNPAERRFDRHRSSP